MVSDKAFSGSIIKMNVDDFANFRKKKKSIIYRDKRNDSSSFFWNSTDTFGRVLQNERFDYKDLNYSQHSYKNLPINYDTNNKNIDKPLKHNTGDIESKDFSESANTWLTKRNECSIERTISSEEEKKKNFESINHPHVVDLNNCKITFDILEMTNQLNKIDKFYKSNIVLSQMSVDKLNLDKIKPVTSYGIVLYTYEKNKYLKYMICQRRDSIAFIQFMRNLIEENEIERYIGLMTIEEKKRCLEYFYKNDPLTIWKDLWVNNRSKIYRQDYKYCSEHFMKNVEKYIELFKNDEIGLEENTWFFPKGRKNDYESDLECALREFEEETNISSSNISVDKNNIFEEFYIGSNNLLYKTVYFTAYIPFIPIKKYKFYPYNIRQKFISGEVYDFEWLDYQSTHKLLNNEKSQVLEKINNFLKRSFKK